MSSATNISKSEGILVISCDQLSPENIVRQILGVETLPDAVCNYNIKGYPWNFETKYYSAEVYLYALEEKAEFDSGFVESIKAVVFCCDSSKISSFDDVVSWMPFLKNIEAEVQLLICSSSSTDESSELQRKNVLNWCVQNQYELVELNLIQTEIEDEDECAIKDFKGYERVIQALQSHSWANLLMKDEQCDRTNLEMKEMVNTQDNLGSEQENAVSNSIARAEGESKDCDLKGEKKDSKKISLGNEELELEEQLLSNVLNGEDPGGESFEALFSKFASMKDKTRGLTGDERKKYAEKVAIAFWRAMGGDEDEIDGLDDD